MKGSNNSRVTKKTKSDISRDTTPLEALNDRQEDYIQAIHQNSVVLCTGVWGSAKTYIPSVIAADLLYDKKINKIVVARPNEGKGKSVGFAKGTIEEKLSYWCSPVTDTLKKRLGLGNYEAYISNGKIEMIALEHIKGKSWDDSFIIVDEAEDLEQEVAKSLVGRQGVNSTMVITGDIKQQDLKKYSGLQYLLDVASYAELPIPVIDFDTWDYCVRSEEAKQWGMAFEQYEGR